MLTGPVAPRRPRRAAAVAVFRALRPRVEQLHDCRCGPVRPGSPLAAAGRGRALLPGGGRSVRPGPLAGPTRFARRSAASSWTLSPADYHLAAIEGRRARRGGPIRRSARPTCNCCSPTRSRPSIDHVRYGRVRPVPAQSPLERRPAAGAPPLETPLAHLAAAPRRRPPSSRSSRITSSTKGLNRRSPLCGRRQRPAAGPLARLGRAQARLTRRARPLGARASLATGELADARPTAMTYDEPLAARRAALSGAPSPYGRRLVRQAAARGDVRELAAARRAGAREPRARALGDRRAERPFVLVNLPAFKAYLIRERQERVGIAHPDWTRARQSPSFRGDLRDIVFNPDWTVPPTILAEDVLGGMKRGRTRSRRRS